MSCFTNYVRSAHKENRGESKTFVGAGSKERFRKGCGTRDAVGVMRTLCERSLECENEVYIRFADFEKAFDRENWVKMFEIMKSLHIDWRDQRLLQDLYKRQEAVVRTVGGDSDPRAIGRGVLLRTSA